MRRNRYLVLAALSLGLAASVTAGPPMPLEMEPPGHKAEEAESLMNEWKLAMRSMNVEEFASFYADNALRILVFPSGGRHLVEGREAIAEQQAAIFRDVRRREPNAFRAFRLPPMEVIELPDHLPILVFASEESVFTQVFQFEERFGRMLISRHVEFIRELEPIEAPEEYYWADENGDGILQPIEQQLLLDQYIHIARGPHRAEGFLDQLFDWDGNGVIDATEAARATIQVYRDGLRKGYRYFPEFTREYIDLDGSEFVSLAEADLAMRTALDDEIPLPRAIESPLDERLDVDMDGWIIRPEQDSFIFGLTRAVASIPEPPITNPTTPADPAFVFWWADANQNGTLDEPELYDIGTVMLHLVQSTELVTNPFELIYDANRDFVISNREREGARAELLRFVEVGRREDLLLSAVEPERLFGRRPMNEVQRQMDTEPEDGRLEEHEVFAGLEREFTFVAERWLESSGMGLEPPSSKGRAVDDRDAGDETDDAAPTQPSATRAAPQPTVPADQVGEEISIAVTFRPVYPVLRKYYSTAALGSVTITNTSEADISNLEASLSLAKYIDQARSYDKVELLAAGESTTIDLTLLFNSTVLEITEGDRVDATVTVSYSGAAGAAQETATETMIFYDRNAIRWDDTEKVAAFVTARDEEIRSYARRVIASVRDKQNSAVDDALQDAMALFIAMVESDVMYFRDPSSSYASASTNASTIDYLQFPRQTLTDFGGDCDDLSVCYNALLESVGRRTAFITVPGHIMSAVALEMSAPEARSAFLDATDLVFAEDGTVWLPVEITALEGSFYEAWQEGATKYRQYSGSGQARLYPTSSAWATYEPVPSVVDDPVEQPDRSAIESEFAEVLSQFVSVQIASRELQLLADLEESPNDRRLLNRLGVLYAQYGLTEKAQTQFEAIIANERYVPALINLGNIAFLEGEYRTAAEYYEDGLELQPANASALLAATRANYEPENMGDVRTYYEQLRAASPRLAADYSYLDLSSSNETARAQAADMVKDRVIWESGEEE